LATAWLSRNQKFRRHLHAAAFNTERHENQEGEQQPPDIRPHATFPITGSLVPVTEYSSVRVLRLIQPADHPSVHN
jgi:hypothetical protein